MIPENPIFSHFESIYIYFNVYTCIIYYISISILGEGGQNHVFKACFGASRKSQATFITHHLLEMANLNMKSSINFWDLGEWLSLPVYRIWYHFYVTPTQLMIIPRF